MKGKELPRKSMIDIILENSTLKHAETTEAPKENENSVRSIMYWVGHLVAFIGFGFLIHLALGVLSAKLVIPSFTYFEVLEMYLGLLIITRTSRK